METKIEVEIVGTKQAAKIVGASVSALARAAWEERFQLPEKDARGRFLWRPENIAAARRYFTRVV